MHPVVAEALAAVRTAALAVPPGSPALLARAPRLVGEPLVAATGRVTPAPGVTGLPHVEQVGWGVGRQVVRVLAERAGVAVDADLAEWLGRLAEDPGFAVWAAFERRTACGAAVLALPARSGDPAALAAYISQDAPDGTREALTVRALHDAARAGAERLVTVGVGSILGPLGFRPA